MLLPVQSNPRNRLLRRPDSSARRMQQNTYCSKGAPSVALTTPVPVNTSVLIVTNCTYYISVNSPRSPSDEDT